MLLDLQTELLLERDYLLTILFLTFDENSREVIYDVLGDSQGVPRVNGPIWENYS